jgi:hypothetical protein
LRTYWRAAASISGSVADGSRPRRVVIFRHMPPGYVALPPSPRTGSEGSEPTVAASKSAAIGAHGPLAAGTALPASTDSTHAWAPRHQHPCRRQPRRTSSSTSELNRRTTPSTGRDSAFGFQVQTRSAVRCCTRTPP